ncbi:MAG: cell division protein ZapA [Candidatus Kapaibacteriota bacterium]
MQETINFEIGGQSYKLIGNNKVLTEKAAELVNEKYQTITNISTAATNREIAFMLTSLNLAEEQVSKVEEFKKDEKVLLRIVDDIIHYVQNEISKLIEK